MSKSSLDVNAMSQEKPNPDFQLHDLSAGQWPRMADPLRTVPSAPAHDCDEEPDEDQRDEYRQQERER